MEIRSETGLDLACLGAVAWAVDRAFVWMERRGWIYWRGARE
jgi:hypothetical protein